jgi:hypothetical protein
LTVGTRDVAYGAFAPGYRAMPRHRAGGTGGRAPSIACVGGRSQTVRHRPPTLRIPRSEEPAMFVAPLSLPSATARAKPVAHSTGGARSPIPWLAGWLLAGLVAVASIPALRGGSTFGATAPFWLVVAPAVDLAWLARARIGAATSRVLRRMLQRTPGQARRLTARAKR